MPAYRLVVGSDGRVKIPGTRPGDVVTIQVALDSVEQPLRSPEERERIVQKLVAGGQRVRETADPEWLSLDHGEWLYGPDGLPRQT